jgi:DNA-binding GntR family transcriptional regulator
VAVSDQGMDVLGRIEVTSRNGLTAHEFARETLRRAILRGKLAGGARLVQADLAAHLRVSTTPIREALRDLATEGLIVLDRHRGGLVRQLSRGEMEDIAMLRSLLEPTAVSMAVERISEAELDAAEALCRRMIQVTDVGAWLELNRKFHYIFHDATRSFRMSLILRSLQDAASVYVGQVQYGYPEIRRESNLQHAALVKAARARDKNEATRIQTTHVSLHVGLNIPNPPTG